MSPKRNRRRKPVPVPRSRPQSREVSQVPPNPPSPSYAGVAATVAESEPQSSRLRGASMFRWIGSWQFLLLTTLMILSGSLAFAV
ncbi:MAG: hypothetical protein AAGF93_13895, partial [Cyanobacteria bacterium P01_H01_bin.105]